MAAQVLVGEADIELCARQLALMYGVSVGYVHLASRLSPNKREMIAAGDDETSFAALRRNMRLNALSKFATAG